MAIASDLDRGKYFIHNGEIHKVNRRELVAYGTHSHTKLKFYIEGLLGSGEKSLTMGHTDRVDIVDIQKKTAQVIAVNPDSVQIMDMHNYETFDGEVTPEIKKELKEGDEVIFIDYNNKITILEKK